MKQFIVLAAVLPLLLLFLSQYALDQRNSIRIGILQEQVYVAKEKAKQEGCFTEEIQAELRENICRAFEIDSSQVRIEATETPQYRVNFFDRQNPRGLILYEVSVPLSRIMAGGNLPGLSHEENQSVYTVRGSAASELLPSDSTE